MEKPLDLEALMQLALQEARTASELGDVPIGAVVVDAAGHVLASAGNRREAHHDVTAHAEILALRAAGEKLGSWRLTGCTIVVTLEPCAMCAAAIVQSRMARVVFGATDPKAGAVVSLFELCNDSRMNHKVPWTAGVLREQSEALLRDFFARRRGG